MNKRIFSLLGSIGASPYMTGAKRLNSQYAQVETLYEQGIYADCIAACGALFDQLMDSLYLSVTGETAPTSVILSDIDFWSRVGSDEFHDTAEMLHYACCRLADDRDGAETEKAASLAKSGLEAVIEHIDRFLSRQGKDACLDTAILKREGVREQIRWLTDSLRDLLEGAGCSDGISMLPPFMNVCLLDFPERETATWARYIAERLRRIGTLSTAELRTLDADRVVTERVGLTNEFIRRASAEANGGALLIEHFEEFDMPCLGGNLLDRALKTTVTAAEKYRGSLCIVVSGKGENVEKAFQRAENSAEYFPLSISLRQA